MFGRGGNQGAEGFDAAAEWYVEGPLEELVRKTASFFEFSPCLSRACLGKMIVFIYKWLKNAVFRRTRRVNL